MFKWLFRWFHKKHNPGSPEAIATEVNTFSEGVRKLRLKHFTARELLTMGASHNDSRSKGFGLNSCPPKILWPKIYRLALVLDYIREKVDAPITLHSVYRNERYNAAIGGAPLSQHKLGQAADISSPTKSPDAVWLAAVRARNKGIFEGGVGVYDTFTHIDIRGERANWDRRS